MEMLYSLWPKKKKKRQNVVCYSSTEGNSRLRMPAVARVGEDAWCWWWRDMMRPALPTPQVSGASGSPQVSQLLLSWTSL